MRTQRSGASVDNSILPKLQNSDTGRVVVPNLREEGDRIPKILTASVIEGLVSMPDSNCDPEWQRYPKLAVVSPSPALIQFSLDIQAS
jgi:hypothetical protein